MTPTGGTESLPFLLPRLLLPQPDDRVTVSLRAFVFGILSIRRRVITWTGFNNTGGHLALLNREKSIRHEAKCMCHITIVKTMNPCEKYPSAASSHTVV